MGTYEHAFRDVFRGIERREQHERHVVLLAPPPGLPERWSHLAEADGPDGGFWFEFYWIPLSADITLAGEQHRLLSELMP